MNAFWVPLCAAVVFAAGWVSSGPTGARATDYDVVAVPLSPAEGALVPVRATNAVRPADSDPFVRWAASPNGDGLAFELEVASTAQFSNGVVTTGLEFDVAQPEYGVFAPALDVFTPEGAEAPETVRVYWRVRAVEHLGEDAETGPWSAVHSFVMAARP